MQLIRRLKPRYTCFVTPHRDADGSFVAQVHQLTRKLDDDPYTDTFWGILTGFDAANALDIAQHKEPLTVRKVAAGTDVALEMCEQGLCYDELVKNKLVRKQPGRYTLAEAFFANHQALIHALETKSGDAGGLAFDRDVVAFYGDPKWEARMASADCAYNQSLTSDGGVWTFRIEPQRGAQSFEPINLNGSQRGYRPIVHWFPQRLNNVQVTSGAELAPVITENFLLIPNPRKCDVDHDCKVVFTAESCIVHERHEHIGCPVVPELRSSGIR